MSIDFQKPCPPLHNLGFVRSFVSTRSFDAHPTMPTCALSSRSMRVGRNFASFWDTTLCRPSHRARITPTGTPYVGMPEFSAADFLGEGRAYQASALRRQLL